MHCVQKKNLFLAQFPGISANSNENYTRYNFQALLIFSENLQPYLSDPPLVKAVFKRDYKSTDIITPTVQSVRATVCLSDNIIIKLFPHSQEMNQIYCIAPGPHVGLK